MSQARILEGTGENFDRLVLENSRRGLVLVDFWSPKAGPSLRQRETLRALAEDYQGRFLLVTVDTDRQKALSDRLGVKSIPACRLFRNGKLLETLYGVQPRADYRAVVERYLTPLGDKVRLAAAKAWNDGDHDAAIRVLAEGAMAEPDNLAIPAMLAKLLMRLGRNREAHKVLQTLPEEAREGAEIATLLAHLDFLLSAEQAPPREELERQLAEHPEDLEARYRLASLALLADDYETALQSLLAILRQERAWQGHRARRGLLALFATLGGEHELVKRYRGELSRLIH